MVSQHHRAGEFVPRQQREHSDWRGEWSDQQRRDRFPLMREVQFEPSEPVGDEIIVEHEGQKFNAGLTVNVGNGGICLLMDQAPEIREILKVHVPMPIASARTPTLAEVCWRRALPFERNGVYVVGLKFLL